MVSLAARAQTPPVSAGIMIGTNTRTQGRMMIGTLGLVSRWVFEIFWAGDLGLELGKGAIK